MLVKTISVTYGRKLNMGQYESAHVEITVWADLDEDDDEAEATWALRQMARNHVREELSRLTPRVKANVEEMVMGLPVQGVKRQSFPLDEQEEEIA